MNRKKLIIIVLILAVVAFLAILASNGVFSREKKFDKTFSVSPASYKPYDVKFFYDQVKLKAKKFEQPNLLNFQIEDLKSDRSKILMIVNSGFYPKPSEISSIKAFVISGNTLIINAFDLRQSLLDSLIYSPKNDDKIERFPPKLQSGGMKINYRTVENKIFPFSYPGHSPVINKFDSVFQWNTRSNSVSAIDTLITDQNGKIEMLKLTLGSGRIYLAKNPIIFSNYFLLHKSNYQFFNEFAREINLDYSTVYWASKQTKYQGGGSGSDLEGPGGLENEDDAGESKVLEILRNNPPLLWFFCVILMGLLLFMFNYLREFLRPIPIKKEVINQSEAYINVISELYWQENGHRSIADKLISQFNDVVYSKTRIQLKDNADEEYERLKSWLGKNQNEIDDLKSLIKSIKESPQIGVQTLGILYEKINKVTELIKN